MSAQNRSVWKEVWNHSMMMGDLGSPHSINCCQGYVCSDAGLCGKRDFWFSIRLLNMQVSGLQQRADVTKLRTTTEPSNVWSSTTAPTSSICDFLLEQPPAGILPLKLHYHQREAWKVPTV